MMLSKTNPEQMESHTVPETNIAPAWKPSGSHPQRKLVFQPSIFMCYVSFGRVNVFVCLFPFCSDVPIKMEGLITMQFQIWVCHRGCLQFNTWAWNPKELFVNGCLVKQPFSF